MSQDTMIALAKEVARSFDAQRRIEDSSDEELTRLGLDADEIRSIRSGFFDRVLQLGIVADDRPPHEQGCCFD